MYEEIKQSDSWILSFYRYKGLPIQGTTCGEIYMASYDIRPLMWEGAREGIVPTCTPGHMYYGAEKRAAQGRDKRRIGLFLVKLKCLYIYINIYIY